MKNGRDFILDKIIPNMQKTSAGTAVLARCVASSLTEEQKKEIIVNGFSDVEVSGWNVNVGWFLWSDMTL